MHELVFVLMKSTVGIQRSRKNALINKSLRCHLKRACSYELDISLIFLLLRMMIIKSATWVYTKLHPVYEMNLNCFLHVPESILQLG